VLGKRSRFGKQPGLYVGIGGRKRQGFCQFKTLSALINWKGNEHCLPVVGISSKWGRWSQAIDAFKAAGGLCQVRHCYRDAQYLHGTEGVRWRLRPACKTEAALFTRAVMLDDKWIALCQGRSTCVRDQPRV